jgi:nitrilase
MPREHRTRPKARSAATKVHRGRGRAAPAVLLDLSASIRRAVELIAEAAKGGDELLSFPETILPGYPEWVWRLRPGGDFRLSAEMAEIHRRLAENAP